MLIALVTAENTPKVTPYSGRRDQRWGEHVVSKDRRCFILTAQPPRVPGSHESAVWCVARPCCLSEPSFLTCHRWMGAQGTVRLSHGFEYMATAPPSEVSLFCDLAASFHALEEGPLCA